MTVQAIYGIKRFYGLSSDDKPTSIPINSLFVETDSRDVFTTYDGTNWVKICRNSVDDSVGDYKRLNSLYDYRY